MLTVIAAAIPCLMPATVVPIRQNLHAAFSTEVGQDIVLRWKDSKGTARMLHALRELNTTCVCQLNVRRGMTIFAAKRCGNRYIVLHALRDPDALSVGSRDLEFAIRDLDRWIHRVS